MKRAISFVFALIMLMSFSACGSVPVQPTPAPTPTPRPTIQVSLDRDDGIIAVGATHTVGVTASREAVYCGHNTYGQNEVASSQDMTWKDIVFVAANDSTTAGISVDGKLSLAGKGVETFAQLLSVENAAQIALGAAHMAVLTRDGFVHAAGDNTSRQCDVLEWNEVKKIAVGDEFTVGLKKDGTLYFAGLDTQMSAMALSFSDVSDIVAGDDFFAVMAGDGTVFTTFDDPGTVTNAERMFAGGNALVLFDNGLAQYTLSNTKEAPQGLDEFLESDYAKELSDIIKLDLCQTHVAIALKDGQVAAFGDQTELACDTQRLALRPIIDGEYITGIAPNTKAGELLPIIEEALALDDATFYSDGEQLGATDIISTGDELRTGNELAATVLIYGDVDCNGTIDERDALMVDDHVAALHALSGIAVLAADPIHAVGARVSELQSQLIRDYVQGTATIRQHAYNPLKESLDEAVARNEDVHGYIRLHDTNIDYPVLYGENWFYHYHNIDKVRKNAGSIYSVNSFISHNIAIAGHNLRKSSTMFNQLHKIQNNKEDLLTYANRVYSIQFIDGYSDWELFALYETEENEPDKTQMDNIATLEEFSDEEVAAWLNDALTRSEIDLNTDVSPNDMFITLYTCGDYYISNYNPGQQARLYLFFRRLP